MQTPAEAIGEVVEGDLTHQQACAQIAQDLGGRWVLFGTTCVRTDDDCAILSEYTREHMESWDIERVLPPDSAETYDTCVLCILDCANELLRDAYEKWGDIVLRAAEKLQFACIDICGIVKLDDSLCFVDMGDIKILVPHADTEMMCFHAIDMFELCRMMPRVVWASSEITTHDET